MIKPSEVTIIIPHLGTTKEQEYSFNECYASLRESVPDIRIVVAKNGPACPHPRDVRVVSQGQCKSVNAAVAITNTPWIFITNDDMIYRPGWFDDLIDGTWGTRDSRSDDHYKYCLSPKLVEPRSGAPTFEVMPLGGAGGDFNKEGWMQYKKDWTKSTFPLRTGFNLPFLIKRELWDLIGGYDINYDPWSSNSDSDLEYKIKLAGIQPYQNANCLVYHFSQTSGTFEPQHQDAWQKNWDYFIEKWGFPRTDEGIWEASFTIPSVEEGRIYQPWWEGHYGH